MAGTMGRLSVGVTGLQTSQYALNATAHNLINTQTEGYTRQQVLLTDQSYNRVATDSYYINNVGMGVVTAQIRQVRDQFADDTYRTESGRMSYYKAQYETVSEIENYFGELEGKDFNTTLNDMWTSMQELQKEYDCLYIAIGAHQDKKEGIPGEDSRHVMSAVEMLRSIGDDVMPDFTGKQVVVIGGGNVAMDVTRSSIRLGADKVTCVYRRRVEDMTALPDEITGALAEGAEIKPLMAPVRIEADENGCATALWVQPQIIGEADKSGRPRPNTMMKPKSTTICRSSKSSMAPRTAVPLSPSPRRRRKSSAPTWA